MKNFADALTNRIKELDNPTVMGLDPKLEYIPIDIVSKWVQEYPNDNDTSTAEAIYDFNCQLIDAVCDIIP